MAEKEYIERKDLINNRPPQRNPDQTGKEEYNKGYNDGMELNKNFFDIAADRIFKAEEQVKNDTHRGKEPNNDT